MILDNGIIVKELLIQLTSSRGCLLDQLISSKFWLKGPCWLYQEFDINNIPKNALEDEEKDIIFSEKVTHSLVCLNIIQLDFNFSAYSRFETILNMS